MKRKGNEALAQGAHGHAGRQAPKREGFQPPRFAARDRPLAPERLAANHNPYQLVPLHLACSGGGFHIVRRRPRWARCSRRGDPLRRCCGPRVVLDPKQSSYWTLFFRVSGSHGSQGSQVPKLLRVLRFSRFRCYQVLGFSRFSGRRGLSLS